MQRLLLPVFIFLSFTVFSQDSVTTDTAAANRPVIIHEIGTERFPAPQQTLTSTLLKGMFSFEINWSRLILAVIIWLMLIAVGVIALVRKRKG